MPKGLLDRPTDGPGVERLAKDLEIVAGAAKDGKVPVTATFDNTHCFEGLPEDMKPARVTFETVEEDGKVVIDDIVRHYEEGDQSLKEEMAEIVKFGESGPPPGEEAPPEGDDETEVLAEDSEQPENA